jgi:hypothetical protein
MLLPLSSKMQGASLFYSCEATSCIVSACGVTYFRPSLLPRATGVLVAAVLVGITQNDVEEELEQSVASVDFQNGLLWYNENVVTPVIGMANEKLEASTQGSRAKQAAKAQLRSAKLLEKKSECFHTVAAYMGGEPAFSSIATLHT